MQWLGLKKNQRTGVFKVGVRLADGKMKKFLRTTNRREAEAIRGTVENTLTAIERGQLTVPEDTVFGDFLISGGKAVAKPTVPRVLSLSQLFTVKEAAKLYASRVLNPIQNFQMPDIPVSPIVQSVEDNLASEFHRRLTEWITDFDSALDNEHEVGVRLVTFGQTVVFHLKNIGYWNPSLITFAGITDNDEPVELIQHVSQISILLMRLPRRNPEEPKQPIGFHAIRQAQEEQ